MKFLVPILLLFFLAGCEESGSDDSASLFVCSAPPEDIVEVVDGDYKENYPSMDRDPDSTYVAGNFCRETYYFREFDENSGDWCYYYQIDISCNDNVPNPYITDIYYSEN